MPIVRAFDTPYIADWLAVSLRWLIAIALVVSLARGGQLGGIPLGVVIGIVFWNVFMSTLAVLSIRVRYHLGQIAVGTDFILAAIFFVVQGGLAGSSAWVGLLPIMTGAVYFGLLQNVMNVREASAKLRAGPGPKVVIQEISLIRIVGTPA